MGSFGLSEFEREFDFANRVSEARYPYGATEVFGYHPGTSHVRRVDGPGDHLRTFAYDGFGHVAATWAGTQEGAADPLDAIQIEFTYNDRGLTRVAELNQIDDDADDSVVVLRPDSLGQVTEEVALEAGGDETAIGYQYTPSGQLKQISSPAVNVQWSYDRLNRITKVTANDRPVADYLFEGSGGPRSVRFGNGLIETRVYDDEGRIRRRSAVMGRTVFDYSLYWDRDGALARVDRDDGGAPGTTSLYAHDAFGRLSSAAHELAGGAVPFMESAKFDSELVQDTIGRADSAEYFTLDAADSWQEVDLGDGAVSTERGIDSRYEDFSGPVEFDARGHPVSFPDGSRCRYDALGRLESFERDGKTWLFSYDPLGRLSRWEQGERGGSYEYAGRQILRAYTYESGQSTVYIPGPGLSPVASVRDAEIYYHHKLFGERLALITNGTGDVVERYAYFAYGTPRLFDGQGVERAQSSFGADPLLITGQPYLTDLGLHRFGERWYRPSWGRFLTPDPLGFFDGPNRYAYAGAQPIMFIDPSGLARQAILDGLVGGYFLVTDFANGLADGSFRLAELGPRHGFAGSHGLGKAIGAAAGLVGDAVGMVGGAGTAVIGGLSCAGGPSCVLGAAAAATGLAVASGASNAAGSVHGPRLVDGVRQAATQGDPNILAVGRKQRNRGQTPATNRETVGSLDGATSKVTGNLKNLSTSRLKRLKIDAEAFKADVVGRAGGRYNIAADKAGNVFLTPVKKGTAAPVDTGFNLEGIVEMFPLTR